MGALLSTLDEAFPPKTQFSVDDIPDLSGKVVIVTGANTGIGKETAKALLAHNAKVYIAARNKEKAERAIAELKKETGNAQAHFLKLDLSDLISVKRAAEEFLSKEKELHILFNNAGVMVPPVEKLTTQGYDLQFGTNVLDGKARVVNTSSSASNMVSDLDFNTFKDSPARKKKLAWILYGQSKLGNVVFARELARRYGDQDIVSTSLNPGNLKSDLQRHLSWIETFFTQLVLYPTPYGALTQLYAGTSREGADLNGEYLIPWARIGHANTVAEDRKLGEELWKCMEEQVAHV